MKTRETNLDKFDLQQNDEDKDADLDLTTYCVSCGIPLAPRIAFRHMEKCWAKVSLTFFAEQSDNLLWTKCVRKAS